MSIAAVVRGEIDAAPVGTWFVVKDLASRLGERRAVEVALSRFAQAGEIVSIRRGVYWKGVKTRFGTTKPDTFAAGIGVLKAAGFKSGIGPTSWSASHALGLSTQIPTETHIAVPGRPPAPSRGVKYHERKTQWRIGMSVLDVALLEVLRGYPYRIEADWETLTERALELHKVGKVDLFKIAEVSAREAHSGARTRASILASLVTKHGQVSA